MQRTNKKQTLERAENSAKQVGLQINITKTEYLLFNEGDGATQAVNILFLIKSRTFSIRDH